MVLPAMAVTLFITSLNKLVLQVVLAILAIILLSVVVSALYAPFVTFFNTINAMFINQIYENDKQLSQVAYPVQY
jgi:multisubunit Na+/H+ antiporter MnhB subunit